MYIYYSTNNVDELNMNVNTEALTWLDSSPRNTIIIWPIGIQIYVEGS